MIYYLLGDLFHDDRTLTAFQMGLRAILVFVIALACVRISGRRAFGMRSPFDNVITLLLGATLSRAIVGDGSFVSVVTATLVLVMVHRLFALVASRSDGFRNFVNGQSRVLFEQGVFQDENLKKSLISANELDSVVRKQINLDSLAYVEKATMESDGAVSIVTRQTPYGE